MAIHGNQDQFAVPSIIDLVMHERALALSVREWKHRLAGYGYAIRDSDTGAVVESITSRTEICVLPPEFSA